MATETHPMGGMQFQVTLALILVYLLIVGNAVPGGSRSAATAREAGSRVA